MVKLSIFEVQT